MHVMCMMLVITVVSPMIPSHCNTNDCKRAEPIEMPFGMWTWVHPRNYVVDEVQIPNRKGHFWGRMTSGFSHMPQSIVPSVPDVGISPPAVDQLSGWLAAEAVECHIKFFEWKSPLCNAASHQSSFFDHSVYFFMFLCTIIVCAVGFTLGWLWRSALLRFIGWGASALHHDTRHCTPSSRPTSSVRASIRLGGLQWRRAGSADCVSCATGQRSAWRTTGVLC